MHKHVLNLSLSFSLLTSCSLCGCHVFLVCLRQCRERGSVRTSVSHIFSLSLVTFLVGLFKKTGLPRSNYRPNVCVHVCPRLFFQEHLQTNVIS
uniref:Putative secreted protein n=1 Tax=Ixodes ricinus TaxID=34613 RepID=A0A6B0U598_IXORI